MANIQVNEIMHVCVLLLKMYQQKYRDRNKQKSYVSRWFGIFNLYDERVVARKSHLFRYRRMAQ